MGFEIDASHVALQGIYKLRFTRERLLADYQIANSADIGDLDICLFTKKEGRAVYASSFARNQFPDLYFIESELDHLVDYPFGPNGNLLVKGIADPNRYLKTGYGSDCLEFGVQTHTHAQFNIPLPVFTTKKMKWLKIPVGVGIGKWTFNIPVPITQKTKYRISENPPCAQGFSTRWQGDPIRPEENH